MKTLLILSFFIINLLNASSINIAVAANVSYAIKDLIKSYNSLYPDHKIRVTLGSSGKLTAQIVNGAPYDIFMSANMDFPNALYTKNLTVNKPTIYAQGSLSMLSAKPQDFSLGLALLTQAHIKRIAIANPKTAPYGKAAKQALQNVKLYEQIKPKLVYAESISQTVAYTIQATNIGLIASSSLFSSKMQGFKEGVHYRKIDSSLYTPINQGIVILKQRKNQTVAQSFYDFVLSAKAKTIFKQYGYLVHE